MSSHSLDVKDLGKHIIVEATGEAALDVVVFDDAGECRIEGRAGESSLLEFQSSCELGR